VTRETGSANSNSTGSPFWTNRIVITELSGGNGVGVGDGVAVSALDGPEGATSAAAATAIRTRVGAARD
jgi:hypothetical protein